jgi:hypothetical protein
MKKIILLSVFLACFFVLYPVDEIKNGNTPLKGNWDFQIEKVWEIDDLRGESIGRIDQISVAENGKLYINDRSAINHIIDENGKLIKSFGKKGEGPGEIIDERASFLLSDMIVIADRSKLHYFTLDGQYIKSVPHHYFKKTPVIFLDEDTFIAAPYSVNYYPKGIGHLSILNLKTGKESIITEFPIFKGGIARVGSAQIVWLVKELDPMMTVEAHGGRLYYGMSDVYKIAISDLNGKKITTFSLDREKKEISNQTKKDLFAAPELKGDVRKALMNSHPDELNHFTHIEIHGKFIYVFLADLENPFRKEIDIFSMDGKYQYRSSIAFAKSMVIPTLDYGNPICIKKNNLYIVLEDEEGTLSISRYKIKLP